MSNFTFNIKNCKVFEWGGKQGKGWGKLVWTDGTITFEQKFQTTEPKAISAIETNRNAEAEFKINGTMTQNQGYGNYAGKTFNNWQVISAELVKNEKEDSEEIIRAIQENFGTSEVNDDIPF